MKLRLSNIVHFVVSGLRPALVGLTLPVLIASISVHAQDAWQVDPQHSIARLSLGLESKSLEVGLARVSGDVLFDSNDPAGPSVSLKITPDQGSVADSAEMSFTSERSALTNDGKLAVTGELSVTRIERSATMDPNEAYAGPVYGDPVAHTDTAQITFVFSDPRQRSADAGKMHFLGASSVSREAFPQLLDAMTRDDWPTQLVNDEKCELPSTIGEDYSGVKCTGTVIAGVSNRVLPTGSTGGEGYFGFQPAVTPDRDRGSIALDLNLKQASAVSLADAGTKY